MSTTNLSVDSNENYLVQLNSDSMGHLGKFLSIKDIFHVSQCSQQLRTLALGFLQKRTVQISREQVLQGVIESFERLSLSGRSPLPGLYSAHLSQPSITTKRSYEFLKSQSITMHAMRLTFDTSNPSSIPLDQLINDTKVILEKQPELEELHVDYRFDRCPDKALDAVTAMSTLKKLQRFYIEIIANRTFTPESHHFDSLKQISAARKTLSLTGTISSELVMSLSRSLDVTRLKMVTLSLSALELLETLKHLEKIETLSLTKNQNELLQFTTLSTSDLQRFSMLSFPLVNVDLSGSAIDNFGVQYILAHCPKLEILNTLNCSQVTLTQLDQDVISKISPSFSLWKRNPHDPVYLFPIKKIISRFGTPAARALVEQLIEWKTYDVTFLEQAQGEFAAFPSTAIKIAYLLGCELVSQPTSPRTHCDTLKRGISLLEEASNSPLYAADSHLRLGRTFSQSRHVQIKDMTKAFEHYQQAYQLGVTFDKRDQVSFEKSRDASSA